MSRRHRIVRLIAWLIVIVGALPIVTWAAGGILASVAGCNYGGSRPCPLGGRDIAGLIDELGMTSLFMLVTILPLTAGVIVLAALAARRRSRRGKSAEPIPRP